MGHLDPRPWSTVLLVCGPYDESCRAPETAGARFSRIFKGSSSNPLSDGMVRIATTWSEYMEARKSSQHVCLPSIQVRTVLRGRRGCGDIPDRFITRATLFDELRLRYIQPTGDFDPSRACLSGARAVRDLDRHRVFVDLAHINPAGFWDAVDEHDPSLPLIVTTGVDGVRPLAEFSDDQIRAIADSGGTIGIIFEKVLSRSNGPRDGGMVIEHLAHIIHVVGEDYVSLGSDYDGIRRASL